MWFERLLFPRCCVVCRKKWGAYICDDCYIKIPFCTTHYCPFVSCNKPAMHGITHERCRRKYGLDGHISITLYRGVMEKVLEFYKRRGVFILEEQIHNIIRSYFFSTEDSIFELFKEPCIIPVPLYWIDTLVRPYDVAERLAALCADILAMPSMGDVLVKQQPTMPQKHLSREKRLTNVQHAFIVKKPWLLIGKEVVLIDDVWTTGATLRACAQALKKVGVRKVWAITLCRGE